MSDPQELEFQIAVSHHVGAGTEPGPPQQQQILLTTEPSLQPIWHCRKIILKRY